MNKRVAPAPFDNSYEGLQLQAQLRAKTIDGKARAEASCALAARTVREWGAEWLDRREASGVRAIKDDRTRWRVHVLLFAPWAGSLLLSVTRAEAREWWMFLGQRRSSCRGRRRPELLAAQTLRNILNLVRRCFADAVDEGLIPFNPFDGLRVHRSRHASTREKSTVADFHEQVIGLRALPSPERWIVETALGSGMRQGEQWNLLLADLHLDARQPYAKARYGAEDGPTKAGKVHTIWLFGMALRALRNWVNQLDEYAPRNPLGLVFPTRSGQRRKKGRVFRAFRRFAAAIGRRFRWHDLRHTCGTSLVGGWWDGPAWSLEEVCAQFGHSSIKVTERYARLAARVAAKAAERMAPPRLPVHVPAFARGWPRVWRRSQRGKTVDNSNNVDAGPRQGENADNGAVAKRLGIGLQNRVAPSEGGDDALKDEVPGPVSVVGCAGCETLAQAYDQLHDASDKALENFAHVRAERDDNAAQIAELLVLVSGEKKRANENAEAHFGALKDCETLRGQLVVAQRRAIDAEAEATAALRAIEASKSVPRVDVGSPSLSEARAGEGPGERTPEALYEDCRHWVMTSLARRRSTDAEVSELVSFVRGKLHEQAGKVDVLAEACSRAFTLIEESAGAGYDTAHGLRGLAEASDVLENALDGKPAHRALQLVCTAGGSDGVCLQADADGGAGARDSGARAVGDGGAGRESEVCDREGVPPRAGVSSAADGGRTLGRSPLKFAKGDRARIISADTALGRDVRGKDVDVLDAGANGVLVLVIDGESNPRRMLVQSSDLDIVPTDVDLSYRVVGELGAKVGRRGSRLAAAMGPRTPDMGPAPSPADFEAAYAAAHRASSPLRGRLGCPRSSECVLFEDHPDVCRRADASGIMHSVRKHVPATGPAALPEDAFKATELGASREAPTRPELADADDGEERATLHLHREELLTLAKTRTYERDTARALLRAEKGDRSRELGELLALKVRHRIAVGLLTDLDKASDRISAFLDAEVKAGKA